MPKLARMRTPQLILLCLAMLSVGGLLGQLAFAQAQAGTKQYSQCFGALTWVYSGSDMNNGEKPTKLVRIPAGWTPVGGGGKGTEGIVILCR
jgi:hypothetical protein